MKNSTFRNHNIFKIILLLSIFVFSCKSKSEKLQTQKELLTHACAMQVYSGIQQNLKEQDESIQKFVENLPIEQKISQLFLVNINNTKTFFPVENSKALNLSKTTDEFLIPGGYLYFSYNILENPQEMIAFNESVKKFCTERNIVPPFLSVDQEGGLVNRLRSLAGPLPSEQRISECLTVEQAQKLYSLQAIQMAALGFHLNLAPVVEVKTQENAAFLGDRSFGSQKNVLDFGSACINGFEQNKIGTVLKHFPGNSNTDPHTGLPEILWDKNQLEENALLPFKRLAYYNPAGILMSHARLAIYDKQTPACLSNYWVTEVLRNQLDYKGLIFSDDIFMAALEKNGFPPEVAAVSAINAGVDCIMLSEKRFASVASILIEESQKSQEFAKKINDSVCRIIKWKINQNILEFYKNESNEIKIRVSKSDLTENRIKKFQAALTENIEFYRTYFMQK